jgi:hypothetical protein
MDAREAARRRKVIVSTLVGLKEVLTTNLWQELDPDEERLLKDLIELGVHKLGVEI